MENLDNVLKGAMPLAGVALGWFISIRTEKYKNTIDQKRKINRILYLLLGFRNEFVRLVDLSRSVELSSKMLEKQFGQDSFDDSDKELIKKGIERASKHVLTNEFISNLKIKFVESVNNLSEFDPILAYKVCGIEDIHYKINLFEQEICAMMKEGEIEFSYEEFKPLILMGYMEVIDEIVREVASTLGRKKKNSVKDYIKIKTDEELIKNMRDGMDIGEHLSNGGKI